MKLIIDILDKDYEKLKDGHIPFSILDVMQNGIPLEQIMDEIGKQAWAIAISDTDRANGMWDAHRIIDKYKGDKE